MTVRKKIALEKEGARQKMRARRNQFKPPPKKNMKSKLLGRSAANKSWKNGLTPQTAAKLDEWMGNITIIIDKSDSALPDSPPLNDYEAKLATVAEDSRRVLEELAANATSKRIRDQAQRALSRADRRNSVENN